MMRGSGGAIREMLETGAGIFGIPLRVVYYARVSTDKVEQQGSLSNQCEYYERYIADKPEWSFAGGYVDDGVSGTGVLRRDGFLKMIDDGRAKKFDLIITKEISRFSRNTLDSIRYTRELLECGVGVYFQNDNINTFMPDSELRLTIMASIAQDEVRRISQRVKFGMKRSVEQGRVLGQDNTTGYRKSGGRLYVDEAGADTVRRIFYLYAEGNMGLRALAKKLYAEGVACRDGKPLAYSTLYGIITNPKYKGYYCGGKYSKELYSHAVRRIDPEKWSVKKDESIPGIVSEEIWERANGILKGRGEVFGAPPGTTSRRYPYSGLIRCETHGTAYHRSVFRYSGGEREVWQCAEYRRHGRNSGCCTPTVYGDDISRAIASVLPANMRSLCTRLAAVYARTAGSDAEHGGTGAAQKIARLKRKKDKLLELCVDGAITNNEFAEKNAEIEKKIENLSKKSVEERQDDAAATADMIYNAYLASPREGVYACAVEKITVGERSISIYMKDGTVFCEKTADKTGKTQCATAQDAGATA